MGFDNLEIFEGFALSKIFKDNRQMNKRIILNIIIVGMLTFYMIFNIVYQRVIKKHDAEPSEQSQQIQQEDVWQQPYLVPEHWHLMRLEIAGVVIQKNAQDSWIANQELKLTSNIASIVYAWQKLQASETKSYSELPLEGLTVLAFVEEDSQPLVFRVIDQEDTIQFYRMIDQKMFSFPLALKGQILPE